MKTDVIRTGVGSMRQLAVRHSDRTEPAHRLLGDPWVLDPSSGPARVLPATVATSLTRGALDLQKQVAW